MRATRFPDGIKLEPVVLTFVSSYEATALISGAVPTITSLTMRLPVNARRLLAAGVIAWMLNHFELR